MQKIYLVFREEAKQTRSREGKPRELYKIFQAHSQALEYKKFCEEEEPLYKFCVEDWDLN